MLQPTVDAATVASFLAGELEVADGRQVVRALLSGRAEPAPWQPRVGGKETGAAVARAIAAVAASAPKPAQRPLPAALLEALAEFLSGRSLQQSESQAARLVGLLPRNDADMAKLLLAESYQCRFDDPARSLVLAELGRAVAGPLVLATPDRASARELLCRAWSELGRAYRVVGELARAEECLCEADAELELGLGDPLVAAQLEERWALLLSDQGHSAQALERQQRSIRIYRGCGARHFQGCGELARAAVLRELGRFSDAIVALRQGVALIDPVRDPRASLAAHHTLAFCLLELGEVTSAASLLPTIRELAAGVAVRLDRMNVLWLEGKIAAAQGKSWAASQYLAAAGGEAAELGSRLDHEQVAQEEAQAKADATREALLLAAQLAKLGRPLTRRGH